MRFKFDDGGRLEAMFRGHTGDCVVRAITIATKGDYALTYYALKELMLNTRPKSGKYRYRTPARGVPKDIIKKYLTSLGWTWTPTMFVGKGCTVHLRESELPSGRIIVSVSRHLVAVVDGVIHDTYDCSRDESRCVYGYWSK